MIGIPCAPQVVVDGLLCSERPECGERIREQTDADGESKTANPYGEHYEHERAGNGT